MHSLRAKLEAALVPIAVITGGYAALLDRNGTRIKTVDSRGEEQVALRDRPYEAEVNFAGLDWP